MYIYIKGGTGTIPELVIKGTILDPNQSYPIRYEHQKVDTFPRVVSTSFKISVKSEYVGVEI